MNNEEESYKKEAVEGRFLLIVNCILVLLLIFSAYRWKLDRREAILVNYKSNYQYPMIPYMPYFDYGDEGLAKILEFSFKYVKLKEDLKLEFFKKGLREGSENVALNENLFSAMYLSGKKELIKNRDEFAESFSWYQRLTRGAEQGSYWTFDVDSVESVSFIGSKKSLYAVVSLIGSYNMVGQIPRVYGYKRITYVIMQGEETQNNGYGLYVLDSLKEDISAEEYQAIKDNSQINGYLTR